MLFLDCAKNVPQLCLLLLLFPGNRYVAEQLRSILLFSLTAWFYEFLNPSFLLISLFFFLFFLFILLFYFLLVLLSFTLFSSLHIFLNFFFSSFFFIPIGVISGTNHTVRTVRYDGGTLQHVYDLSLDLSVYMYIIHISIYLSIYLSIDMYSLTRKICKIKQTPFFSLYYH